MEIILSQQCKSMTGSLGRGFGYHIQKRKNGFFTKRNSKGDIPCDGHWRFIVACAELAGDGLHIAEIKVGWTEMQEALEEAGYHIAAQMVHDYYYGRNVTTYNAKKVLTLNNVTP